MTDFYIFIERGSKDGGGGKGGEGWGRERGGGGRCESTLALGSLPAS